MPAPVHTAIIEEEVEEEALSSELADSVADDSDEDALQEGDDVVPALPGLTGYLGSFFASATPAAGSGYAFGAQMDNPFAEMSASPFDLCRTSIDLRNRSIDLRQSVDNFRRTSDGHSSMMSACQRASIDCMGRTVEIDRCVQGVTVHDLLHLTTDPRVKKRLLKTETDEEGRISPSEILAVMSRELSTKKKLKLGVVMGGVLVLLVLLLLGANAALTFSMVALSKDSSVQSSGVLTAKDGGGVVGTATSAAMVNLLYAHHTTQESAAALLAMKSLVVNTNTSAGDTSTFVYQVLAATLVPALHLELVVTARSAAAAALDVSKLMRIYIDDKGVHEVRGGDDQGTAAAGRRLLVDAGAGVGSVQGMVSDMATNMCGPTTSRCSPITTQMSCPAVQTCGMDGLPYASPCAARSAGTVVRCTNCPLMCATSTATAGPDQQGQQQEQQAAAEVTAVSKAAVGTAAVDKAAVDTAAAAAEQARTEQQQEGQAGIGLEESPQFVPVDVGVTNTLDASLRFSVMSWAADTAWVPALQGFRISLFQETAVAGQYLPIPGWTARELVTKLDAAHPTMPPRLQVSASTDGSQKTYYRLDAVLKGPFPTFTRGGGSRVRFEVASVRLDGTVSEPVTVESAGGRR